jgi:CheY-like chemotaxis protein
MKKILLLDDNQDILEIVEEVLSYEQFDVLSQRDDANIMRIAEDFNHDLILTDYRLGSANGGELCLQFKANPRLGDVPVVIFSAYIHQNMDFSKYGCDAVIEKPFNLDDLTQTINKLTTGAN